MRMRLIPDNTNINFFRFAGGMLGTSAVLVLPLR